MEKNSEKEKSKSKYDENGVRIESDEEIRNWERI